MPEYLLHEVSGYIETLIETLIGEEASNILVIPILKLLGVQRYISDRQSKTIWHQFKTIFRAGEMDFKVEGP